MASIFDKPKNQSTPSDVFKPKPTPAPKSSLTNVTQPATAPKPKPKGGGGSSNNAPQSTVSNITPTATTGQTTKYLPRSPGLAPQSSEEVSPNRCPTSARSRGRGPPRPSASSSHRTSALLA